MILLCVVWYCTVLYNTHNYYVEYCCSYCWVLYDIVVCCLILYSIVQYLWVFVLILYYVLFSIGWYCSVLFYFLGIVFSIVQFLHNGWRRLCDRRLLPHSLCWASRELRLLLEFLSTMTQVVRLLLFGVTLRRAKIIPMHRHANVYSFNPALSAAQDTG